MTTFERFPMRMMDFLPLSSDAVLCVFASTHSSQALDFRVGLQLEMVASPQHVDEGGQTRQHVDPDPPIGKRVEAIRVEPDHDLDGEGEGEAITFTPGTASLQIEGGNIRCCWRSVHGMLLHLRAPIQILSCRPHAYRVVPTAALFTDGPSRPSPSRKRQPSGTDPQDGLVVKVVLDLGGV